jgi:DNA processing protein
LIVGENAYGTQPLPWRFPIRNRIIAALADAVVVIEATRTGGARITANYGLDYSRDVFALPGSRRNPAAGGCNELIRDGANPLLDPSDVLFAVGRGAATRAQWTHAAPPPDPDERAVLKALAGEPATLDDIERRVELGVERVGPALRGLERSGRVRRSRGYWWPE